MAENSPNGKLVNDFKRVIRAFRVAVAEGWAEGVAANVHDHEALIEEVIEESEQTAPQEQHAT